MDKSLDEVVKERRLAAKMEKQAKAAKAAKSKKPVKKAAPVSKKTSAAKAVKSTKPVKVMSKPVKVSRGHNNGITSRLGGGSDFIKVMIMGLSRGISRGEIVELCNLVTKKVNVELYKPGAADIYCGTMKDAKALIKRFNGVTLDGRPMTLKLDEGDVGYSRGGRNDRDDRRGGRVVQKVVSRPSSRKGSRNDPPPRQALPKAKKVVKKSRPVREKEAPKSSEDLESEMKAYFASK